MVDVTPIIVVVLVPGAPRVLMVVVRIIMPINMILSVRMRRGSVIVNIIVAVVYVIVRINMLNVTMGIGMVAMREVFMASESSVGRCKYSQAAT